MRINNLSYVHSAINKGQLVGHMGAYGVVKWYDEKLFKFDKEIFVLFFNGLPTNTEYQDFIRSIYYELVAKPSVELIEYFDKVRDKIKLTKLPEGILYYHQDPLAYILPYHQGYKNLSTINFSKELVRVAYLLEQLLEALYELENNGIYQTDLNDGENILYNGRDIQIIDLDGEYLKIGDKMYRENMYLEFLNIMKILFNVNKNKEIGNIIADNSGEKTYTEMKKLVKKVKRMV